MKSEKNSIGVHPHGSVRQTCQQQLRLMYSLAIDHSAFAMESHQQLTGQLRKYKCKH